MGGGGGGLNPKNDLFLIVQIIPKKFDFTLRERRVEASQLLITVDDQNIFTGVGSLFLLT
jgi:hypothetical protein